MKEQVSLSQKSTSDPSVKAVTSKLEDSLSGSTSTPSSVGIGEGSFSLGPTDGTGPMALRNLKAETGLGLPM